MNLFPGIPTRRVALLGCALVAACSSADDLANLGVYYRGGLPPEAGIASDDASAPSNDQVSTQPDAAQDAGPAAAQSEDAGSLFAGAPPCARTGCVLSEPVPSQDPGLHCHQVIVGAGESPPLPPGTPAIHYVGYTTPIPVTGKEFLRSIRPIIDDAKSLHHMKIYESEIVPADPNQLRRPARRLLFSWSPGEAALFLDPSIGIEVPPGAEYSLELHYGDTAQKAFDGSGFELCFTPTVPDYPVSLSTVYARGPAAGPVTGTCAAKQAQPILLISAQPELTDNGTHVRLAIKRQAGGEDLVLDAPYDPEYSLLHRFATPLWPGDTLSTRCEYSPPPGPPTGVPELDFNAVCDVYVLHWPAHTLVSPPQPGQADTFFENCR